MTPQEKLMGKQLRAAGWKKLGVSDTWRSPNTGLFLKRKKAWRLMLARRAVLGFGQAAVELCVEGKKDG
jgi:hypothetical protein